MQARSFRVRRENAGSTILLLIVSVLGIPFVAVMLTARHGFQPQALLPLLLAAVAMPVFLWTHWRYVTTGRLVVDDDGLEVKIDMPPWLGFGPERAGRVRWSDIAKVRVLETQGVLQLHRKGSMLPMIVRVIDWVPADGSAAAPARIGFLGRPNVCGSDLWKALDERGLFSPGRFRENLVATFDLAKHPATRAAMVAMAVLAGYWSVDALVSREAWAEWSLPYLTPHVVIGVVALAIAFAILRASRAPHAIPAPICAMLAVLVGVSAGLASWTGLIRVNEAFGGPLEPHAYVRNASCDALLPVEAGLPVIHYSEQAHDYWCHFPPNWQHTVRVRKGLGDLFQVDLSEHTRAIRRFHELPLLPLRPETPRPAPRRAPAEQQAGLTELA